MNDLKSIYENYLVSLKIPAPWLVIKNNLIDIHRIDLENYNSDELFMLKEIFFKYDVFNSNFNWENKQIYQSNLIEKLFFQQNLCIAQIDLPNDYRIKKINTGQFKRTVKLWQKNVDFRMALSKIMPFNFTDKQWTRGIHKNNPTFFIANTFDNRQSIRIGDTLFFKHSGKRKIKSISYGSSYIGVHTEGKKLNTKDGYPNKVKIL